MRRTLTIAASAALALGLTLAGASSANAADYTGANRDCSGTWTWSGVTSSAKTVHQHTSGGWWSKAERDAGTTSLRGLYNRGPALLQADTSGTFSSWAFGCQ